MPSPQTLPYSATELANTDITTTGTQYTGGVTIPAQATRLGVSVRFTVPAGALTGTLVRVSVQTAVAAAAAGDASSWQDTGDVLLFAGTGENTLGIAIGSPVLDKVRLKIVTSTILGGGTLRLLHSWACDSATPVPL